MEYRLLLMVNDTPSGVRQPKRIDLFASKHLGFATHETALGMTDTALYCFCNQPSSTVGMFINNRAILNDLGNAKGDKIREACTVKLEAFRRISFFYYGGSRSR